MSLPSIFAIATERHFDLNNLSEQDQEDLLVEAMRRDLPLAVAMLHTKSHDATEKEGASWLQDPNSEIGKQLIRLHASDAMRPLASKYFCHGKQLTFVNCCGGIVGVPPKNIQLLQIQQQAGPIAYADC